ncbi:MAG: hypothetical protein DIU69_09325 [Bacillota bacterium]|nr:MAG: hypothetical protein DIU69_09325 [Bacillota bacterium]
MSEVRITLRMDEALHRVLVQLARKNRRSLNSEILVRLEESIAQDEDTRQEPREESVTRDEV